MLLGTIEFSEELEKEASVLSMKASVALTVGVCITNNQSVALKFVFNGLLIGI